jgi:hypothetical protein
LLKRTGRPDHYAIQFHGRRPIVVSRQFSPRLPAAAFANQADGP